MLPCDYSSGKNEMIQLSKSRKSFSKPKKKVNMRQRSFQEKENNNSPQCSSSIWNQTVAFKFNARTTGWLMSGICNKANKNNTIALIIVNAHNRISNRLKYWGNPLIWHSQACSWLVNRKCWFRWSIQNSTY